MFVCQSGKILSSKNVGTLLLLGLFFLAWTDNSACLLWGQFSVRLNQNTALSEQTLQGQHLQGQRDNSNSDFAAVQDNQNEQNLPETNYQGTYPQNANLQNPNLQNPNLQNPNLQNPNLQNPNLQNPNLQNPNLQNPNLQNPNLQGSDNYNQGQYSSQSQREAGGASFGSIGGQSNGGQTAGGQAVNPNSIGTVPRNTVPGNTVQGIGTGENGLRPEMMSQPTNAISPPPFQLTEIEQQKLDQFLQSWENYGKNIKRVSCYVHRKQYDGGLFQNTSGVQNNTPSKHTWGEFRFISPNKLLYHIKGEFDYSDPVNNPKGEWKAKIGEEKTVFDGKSLAVFNYKSQEVTVHAIPENEWGMDLTLDSQFPLFFIANAQRLKNRFYLRLCTPQSLAATQVWIEACPRLVSERSDFQRITVILNLKDLQPVYLRQLAGNGKNYVDLEFQEVKLNQGLWKIENSPSDFWNWKKIEGQTLSLRSSAPAAQTASTATDTNYPAQANYPAQTSNSVSANHLNRTNNSDQPNYSGQLNYPNQSNYPKQTNNLKQINNSSQPNYPIQPTPSEQLSAGQAPSGTPIFGQNSNVQLSQRPGLTPLSDLNQYSSAGNNSAANNSSGNNSAGNNVAGNSVRGNNSAGNSGFSDNRQDTPLFSVKPGQSQSNSSDSTSPVRTANSGAVKFGNR